MKIMMFFIFAFCLLIISTPVKADEPVLLIKNVTYQEETKEQHLIQVPEINIGIYVVKSVEVVCERKGILHEEFKSVIVKPKFRPQAARRNITDSV